MSERQREPRRPGGTLSCLIERIAQYDTTTSGTAGSQGSVGYVLEQFDDVVQVVLVELAADGVLLLLEDLEFCSTDPRV